MDVSQAAAYWGRNGNDTHDTSRPDNNTKSVNSSYRKKNVGHRWRRFYVWTLWLCILEDFDPSTVSGNPVYQCRICENNYACPVDTQEHQIWWRFVGSLAHWMLAGFSALHFGCCHEPVYSPSYVGATACPLIPSNDRNALNG